MCVTRPADQLATWRSSGSFDVSPASEQRDGERLGHELQADRLHRPAGVGQQRVEQLALEVGMG